MLSIFRLRNLINCLLGQITKQRTFSSFPVSSFLLLSSLIVGLLIVPSYGIFWDEPSLRSHGTFNLINALKMLAPSLVPAKYFICNSKVCFPALEDWNAWTHGAWFEMILSGFEVPLGFEKASVLGQEKMHDIYIMRHYIIFLFCWFGLLNLIFFVRREFESDLISTAAIILGIASPRVFANAFYNSKDLVFCALIAIGMNSFSSYIHSPKLRKLFSLAFILGLIAGIRIVGFLLIIIAIFFLFLWYKKKGESTKQIAFKLFLLGIVSFVTLVASMPYLWKSPFVRLFKVLKGNADFDWNGTVIFAGNAYQPLTSGLPRTYLPVWLLISIPMFQIALILIGLAYGIRMMIAKPKINIIAENKITTVVFSSFCLACFIITIILNPTNYDGWRHYYFFSPIFIVFECLAIFMLRKSLQSYFTRRNTLILIMSFLLLGTLPTYVWMFRNHPMQNLYMNKFAGKDIQDRWEWNGEMGNVNALRWILRVDSRNGIIVGTMSDTLLPNASILLNESEKERLILLKYRQEKYENQSPDYVINTFYGLSRRSQFANYILVKEYKVNSIPYLQIYRKKA